MRCWLTILLLSSCAVAQTADPTPVDGRISGTVVNEKGKPVAEATVYLSEEATSLVDAMSVTTSTNAAGRFDFGRKLRHGRYEIYARKDTDGYPDPASKFYRSLNFSPQYVQLFGEHPATRVTVELQDQAALVAGRVFDADTGAGLRGSIGFTNLRTEGGHGVVAEKGSFQELIPANTDVYILVEYVPRDHAYWSIFTTQVNLQPGQRMNLNVPLFKKVTPPDTPE